MDRFVLLEYVASADVSGMSAAYENQALDKGLFE